MHTWANVAELLKVKAQEGRFVVRSTRNLPFLLEEGMEVAFVPPQLDAPRRARVESIKHANEQVFVVGFDAVSDRATAERLVGCFCLVKRSDLAHVPEEKPSHSWKDFEVCDVRHGDIGVIAEVIENPAQSLLVVQGIHGEILIPLVEEFVLEVDVEHKVLKVEIPEGLLRLNIR